MIRMWAFVAATTLLLLACGDSADPTTSASSTTSSTTPSTTSTTTTTPSTTTSEPAVVEVSIDADSFRNINDMTPVRGFFVDNLLGDLEATVAVAENPEGSTYPVGSLVQLVPGEAMVKREAGFSPPTGDWEFFELVASTEGTDIRVRGGDQVVNSFGSSCANCHLLAEPQWDLICEQDHGCEPLPIGRDVFEVLQAGDPRPRD